jgi:hypothetical protein
MRKDIEHFVDACRNMGFDFVALRVKWLGGADGLVDLVNHISGHQQKEPQTGIDD